MQVKGEMKRQAKDKEIAQELENARLPLSPRMLGQEEALT